MIPGFFESLSERETSVAQLLVTAASVKDIAYSLGITPATVNLYTARIFRKKSIHTRVELIVSFYSVPNLSRHT